MVIRHAEEPASSGASHGVLPSGEQDGESLTTTGWARAGAMVGLFDPVSAEWLRGVRTPTLVAWEHQAVPAVVAGLGPVAPAPPPRWPGDRFDLVWCFTRTDEDSGWRSSQVPQLLLAGDSADLP